MKPLHTFEEFVNESTINEGVNYYSVDFARKQNKDQYEYKEKVIDLAEEGIEWLKGALKEVEDEPGVFDIENFGFAFAGNAAFVLVKYADPKLGKTKNAWAYEDEIKEIKGYRNYFDISANPSTAGTTASKEYNMAFRLII